jgi:hypothetical protein
VEEMQEELKLLKCSIFSFKKISAKEGISALDF